MAKRDGKKREAWRTTRKTARRVKAARLAWGA